MIHVLSGTFGALMAWQRRVARRVGHGATRFRRSEFPRDCNHVPVAMAGALIVLFSIEHIIALFKGETVVPSWH